ncbi:thermonuclease family protein [Xanthobacter sp. V13C-7B]|uniref:thermonuclease family protein n=1 Tax=Xanthobacter variabilis TaxID=3119932 RepID=UPI00372C498A
MRLKHLLLVAAAAVVGAQADWSVIMGELARSHAPAGGVDRKDVVSGHMSVVDGDTLIGDAGRHRIRLFGIDAPESAQTCLDDKGQRYLCGTRAAEALATLLGRNGLVDCTIRDTDHYQRLVADCTTSGGVDLNREMVRSGWALDYAQYSRGRFAPEQREAQIEKRGLWAGTFEAPARWRAENAH